VVLAILSRYVLPGTTSNTTGPHWVSLQKGPHSLRRITAQLAAFSSSHTTFFSASDSFPPSPQRLSHAASTRSPSFRSHLGSPTTSPSVHPNCPFPLISSVCGSPIHWKWSSLRSSPAACA